jgi:RNA polymerase sigma factor (sigma-70 family)
VLGDAAEVEDAFQATFLVLVRRAGGIRQRELLAAWLYGVAQRVSARVRALSARRRAREGQAVAVEEVEAVRDEPDADLQPLLHEEIDRLPPPYRRPVVLCYLQGKTNAEAARELRCPAGTLKGRLSRARRLLRARLSRRGLALLGRAV